MIKLMLFRKKYKITQEELSAFLGISRRSLSYKETGQREFTRSEMLKVIEFFKERGIDITIEDIFF